MLVGTGLAYAVILCMQSLDFVMRHLTWVILAFVTAAFLVVAVMSSASASAFTQLGYPDYRWAGLVTSSSLIALTSGVIVFFALIRNRKAMEFTDEVVGELAMVTWPTRDETVRASVTVVFTTIFTAGLMAIYDLIWKNIADYFLFTGGTGS